MVIVCLHNQFARLPSKQNTTTREENLTGGGTLRSSHLPNFLSEVISFVWNVLLPSVNWSMKSNLSAIYCTNN